MTFDLSPTLTMSNGVEIPRVGYGTWEVREPSIKNCMKYMVEDGYVHIDTASVYQNESDIANALSEVYADSDEYLKARNAAVGEIGTVSTKHPYPVNIETGNKYKIFITSKAAPNEIGPGVTETAYQNSCKRLGIDKLDLYLLHWPGTNSKNPTSAEHRKARHLAWHQLETLYKEGKVRSIGVSNFMIKHLEELAEDGIEITPHVNQFEFHPLIADFELVDYCKKKNIIVEAYSSLGAGDKKVIDNPTVLAIAKETDRTPGQVLYRWGLQHGTVILPRTKTISRLEENLSLFDFSLNEEQMKKLDALNTEKYRTCWDPKTMN